MNTKPGKFVFALLGLLAMLLSLAPAQPAPVFASDTPDPAAVTLVGSLQSELGCPGDWQPDCAATSLVYDPIDRVWQQSWSLPAGSYEYKVALNNSWDENYGQNATRNGANLSLNLSADATVKFYYDHQTHWITSSRNAVIATVPGNFQSELGCAGDWDPGCLRSWLQDPDGDGSYRFVTSAIPAGNYEAKVAINELWDENYGAGGAPSGANIPFTVPADGVEMIFTYDPVSHLLTIQAGNQSYPDNNVEWDGLRHDSRDPLYRAPGGAVSAGIPVILRLRTFHNDVTDVRLRVFDLNAGSQRFYPMRLAASAVSCYQSGLEARTCDFWQVVLPAAEPNNLWYRFIITDGTDGDYYADNTHALDGGLGAPSDEVVDNSYALMIYDPGFSTPAWAKNALIYQIFPDRFRNGDRSNDPQTGDSRYDDPVLALPWGTLPEGYCRHYSDAGQNCPWRFDDTPPAWSPTVEGPRGRDYYGGDLKGVTEQMLYLKRLGVTAIYFNPIFYAKSNHRYDTAGYFEIDPALGTLEDFRAMLVAARRHGIRIILDGVFNHMSSDSPYFDRYGMYATLGACESGDSAYRTWFYFRPPSPNEPSACAPSLPGRTDTFYDSWFGFDSIPVIDKYNPEVQDYFLASPDSVSRYWLRQGAAGWRLDVMGDASFPADYWEAFRQIVKEEDPNALIVGELWQKDSTLLRFLRGDRADTAMNYRLRDAVLGLLSPGAFDSKGFADSGRPLSPAEFSSRVESIREDYPDVVYYAMMNLLGSHDTERILWALTPGLETRADKEFNRANLAEGLRRSRIAALIQFTMPGAPTIYYGDEVAVTGDDDPDDRRTYPWLDTGGSPNAAMLRYYGSLATIRRANPALTQGDLRMLLADDASGVVAYGRKTTRQAAVVVVNRGLSAWTGGIPVSGYLPEGALLQVNLVTEGGKRSLTARVQNGMLPVSLERMSAVLLTSGMIDLLPPAPPSGLSVTGEGSAQVSLAWNVVSGAAGYNLYRSPLSGGGFVRVNPLPLTGSTFTDSGLENARTYFYVVTALDAAGNESGGSNEVNAMPHYPVGWANLQWPPTLTHTISVFNRTDTVYGQVWIDGVTSQPGATPGLLAELGYGPSDSQPAGNPDWTWVSAVFNVDAGNNDEFYASLLPEAVGTFDYAFRYSTTNGRDWVYADRDGTGNGYDPAQAGKLSVLSSGDETPPPAPHNLTVLAASPAGIRLGWEAVSGDPSLYGYEVRRSLMAGGPYVTLALVAGVSEYTDPSVDPGATYYYVVRAVDTSFNRSEHSAEVQATAQLRTVTVTFNVSLPATTAGTGRSVFIAGTLHRLDGNLPEWNPGGVVMTQVDATTWRITLTGLEATPLEYKYTLGSWDFVEKGAACDEIGNRLLTLTYGSDGQMTVNDQVLNWRNVAPCGN